MTTRRDFIKTAALGAGALTTGGCSSLCGETSFYGPTIRDRLWMWGHHKDMCHKSGITKDFKWQGPAVEQAEGCRLMGIPNDCVIRWGNKPVHPWGDYFEQFRSLKRITFGITDGGNGSVWDKLDWAINEIKPAHPNLTGGFLDDFFSVPSLTQPLDVVRKIAGKLHANDLRLSVVVYADQDGVQEKFRPFLDCCDETSFWCWHSANLVKMADSVKRMRDFIGPKKDLLMGVYMWDYTLGAPVPGDRTEKQLSFARDFLRQGIITGLIFHPTYSAALDVPSVNVSKQWIKQYADDRWGE